MKNKILASISFLVVIAVMFSSCEKPPIEEANENYNYDEIIPKIFGLSGNTSTMQGRYYDYKVIIRGGSVYDWSTKGNTEIVDIEGIEGDYKVRTYFPDVGTDEIYVTETTQGGVTSEPDTLEVESTPFVARPIEGPQIVNGGFSAKYTVNHSSNDELYSTWEWSSEKGTVTFDDASSWNASIAFSNSDTGKFSITNIETNDKGITDEATYPIEVFEYCPLDAMSDLVGTWSGTDGFDPLLYTSEVVTAVPTESGVDITGLNFGWMVNWWGETVTDGGTVELEVNEDGTVNIPRQFYITTDYDNAPYDYEIEGSGRWNNCGDYTTLIIEYVLYNTTDEYELPSAYYSDYATVFTATLELSGKSTNITIQKDNTGIELPAFKRK